MSLAALQPFWAEVFHVKTEDAPRDFDGPSSSAVCHGASMSLMVDTRLALRRGGWEERGWGWQQAEGFPGQALLPQDLPWDLVPCPQVRQAAAGGRIDLTSYYISTEYTLKKCYGFTLTEETAKRG